jgi:hypothetical protein
LQITCRFNFNPFEHTRLWKTNATQRGLVVQRFTFKTCACKAFPRVSRPHTLWKVKSTILLMPVPSLGLEVTSPCNTKAKSVLTGFEPVRAKPSRFQVCPVNHSGTKPTWNGQKPWEGSVPGFEPGTSCTQSRNHTTRPNGHPLSHIH